MTKCKIWKKVKSVKHGTSEVRTTVNKQLNTFVSGLRAVTQPQTSASQTVSSLRRGRIPRYIVVAFGTVMRRVEQSLLTVPYVL